jgi:hypothetical protein
MADEFKMTVDVRKLREIAASLPRGINDLLAAVGTEMVGDMQMGMLNSPADGEVYGDHQASSPGNPPRPDTAELLNSVTHTKTGEAERVIHDQVEYGKYQEFGTEDIEPRPWMKPVFEAWQNGKFSQFVDNFPLVR